MRLLGEVGTDAVDMEVDEGLPAFFAEEEVAVGGVVHEEIFGAETVAGEGNVRFLRHQERGILMPLFVRKNKDDQTSKEFYFLGTMRHNGHLHEFVMNDTEDVTAVEIGYKLDTPVESNLYEYITEQSL